MTRHDTRPFPPQQSYIFRARVLRSAAFMLMIGDIVRAGRAMARKSRRWAKGPLWAGVEHLWTALSRRLASRAARRALHRLDDRMLKDIGVSRGEIESVVRHRPADRRGVNPPSPTTPMRHPTACG